MSQRLGKISIVATFLFDHEYAIEYEHDLEFQARFVPSLSSSD